MMGKMKDTAIQKKKMWFAEDVAKGKKCWYDSLDEAIEDVKDWMEFIHKDFDKKAFGKSSSSDYMRIGVITHEFRLGDGVKAIEELQKKLEHGITVEG